MRFSLVLIIAVLVGGLSHAETPSANISTATARKIGQRDMACALTLLQSTLIAFIPGQI